jgi:flagellar biosynthetic protein FlhF
MIIKKFLANTENEAIEMAKQELGSGAVVMNIKKIHPRGLSKLFVRSKVEVTAALEENTASTGQTKQDTVAREKVPEAVSPLPVPPMPEEKEDEQSIREKLKKLEMLLEQQMQLNTGKNDRTDRAEIQTERATDIKAEEVVKPASVQEDQESEKTVACKELIHKQLIQNEVEPEIADQIMDEVNRTLPFNAPLDQILASVYQRLVLMMGQPYLVEKTDKDARTKFIFFLGSTGVGKTTTIAKIASKLKLNKKANIALITADTYRIAAVEQLKTYANILSVPLKVIYSPGELGEIVEDMQEYDYCLVDTAGRSHKNKEQLKDIRTLIEQVPISERQVFLVLNAGVKYNDLMEIADVYAGMSDYSVIFTKLDETSSAGAMLNIHVRTQCPLAYVTMGQNVPDDIAEVNPQKVAKQLLGGSAKNGA